jgi:sterol 3beta-glucosyltransferase
MRIVISGYGSEGDTRPFLALAAGLIARGHEVTVCADRNGAELAAALRVPFRTLDGDFRSHLGEGGKGRAALESSDGGMAGLLLFRDLAAEHTGAWVNLLVSTVRDVRAELIIASGLTIHAGLTAAEVTGVRAAIAGAFPVTPTTDFPTVVAPPTARIPRRLNSISHHLAVRSMWLAFRRPTLRARRRLGLGRPRWRWAEIPVLYGFSPVLVAPPADWTPNVAVCGEWHLTTAGWESPPDLVDFLATGEPPVHIGFGSMSAAGNVELVRTLVAGLDGRRALLSTGWSGLDEATLGPLPDTVHLIGPTPHSWLLPQCAAVVHHCGAGTTHAAARAGIPSIPVPFAADQPFWAARLAAVGAGTAALDRHRLTVADVRAALTAADDPELRASARSVAGRMATEDSIAAAESHLATWLAPARVGR